MQIFVQTFEGKSITLKVEPNDTIGDVKGLIYKKTKIPQEKFSLHSRVKSFMDDAATLQDCGIGNEQTLLMHPVRKPDEYDENVKPLLKQNILELIEQVSSANIFILVCLGCYDHGHGDESIKRQQCPDGLLEACRKAGYQLRILLIDAGFGDNHSPQIYNIDPKWKHKGKEASGKVVQYKYAEGDAQLFTFATKVLPKEYCGELPTLADVNLAKSFPDMTNYCLVVGNFYDTTARPHLVKGGRSIADSFFTI